VVTVRLSLVAAARNDDYGGDFLGRMTRFLGVLYSIGRAEGLDAEVVLVEWNPPAGRPRLAEAIDWRSFPEPLPTRILHVPEETHARLPNSGVIPLHEYVAKNVGIRRARGEFVLSTNPDLLFGRGLVRLLARDGLERGHFYRVDRYDVREAPPRDPRAALRFCARHIWKVHTRGRSLTFARPPSAWRRAAWSLLGGYELSPPAETGDPLTLLHTNASGDFLVMHREDWHRLHGYPELGVAGHADSYMCAMARAAGLVQRALPPRYRIYHQEHPRAVDWSNPEASARPVAEQADFERRARAMFSGEESPVYNDEDWGLAAEHLEETVTA
jgi:hypothetical protein